MNGKKKPSGWPDPAPITMEAVRSLFYLTPCGSVHYRETRGYGTNRVEAGEEVGQVSSRGYRFVTLYGRKFQVHRIAFALHYGYWPQMPLDHINGNKIDNRPENLREVSTRANGQNRPEHRAGHLPGTTYREREGRWIAQALFKGKKRLIGRYESAEAAHSAYIDFVRSNDSTALGDKT